VRQKNLKNYLRACWRSVCAWDQLAHQHQKVESGLREEFIAYRFVCKVKEVDELISVYQHFWGEDFHRQVRFKEKIQYVLSRAQSKAILGSIVARQEMPIFTEATGDLADNCISFIFQLRNHILFHAITDKLSDENSNAIVNTVQRWHSALKSLPASKKIIVERALTSYLETSFLPLFAEFQEQHNFSERYMPFRQALQFLRGGDGEMNIQNIDSVLRSKQLSQDIEERVRNLLARIQEILRDYDLSSLTDLFDDGGDVGQIIGSGRITVIPSEGNGPCNPIVLAVTSGNVGQKGLKNVLRKVRSHLIDCFEVVEVVVVLTDRWDKNDWKESGDDFIAHLSHHRYKKVFIPVVCWKGQMTVYDWP
jgi:hypothetical protein